MMSQICPECGEELPITAGDAMCPKCLLNLGLTTTASPDFHEAATPEAVGAWIGHYRLAEVIGEGGFGTVWMAEQERPVRRRVALKVLKPGMDTREVVARFEAERQALALMDHPHIAKVLDGGTTVAGRPFFVMELVGGVTITKYCDTQKLGIRQRLNLMILVCEAIQHAHQKGIIHRDLKPGNVLVSTQDGRAAPKVIDFGVAKALEQPLTDKTLFTRFHQFVGTPVYMSPEQATLGGLDVDTRSDIYSLGVLLYELLTGLQPFDPRAMNAGGWEAVVRTIRESEPMRPSTRVSTLSREDLEALASRRQETPLHLCGVLRGELDWIILKAMEKDRSRRYASANDLAADLRAYLEGEPVNAAPPTVRYRMQKFVRKHRTMVGFSTALLVILVSATIFSLRQAVRATRHAAAEMELRRISDSNGLHLRYTVYAADMTLAAQAIEQGSDETARVILAPHTPAADLQGAHYSPLRRNVTGWEWRYLSAQAEGDPGRAIPGHTNMVTAVAWPDGGERLLSASFDGTLREWEFATGKELRRWTLEEETLSAVAVQPSQRRAAVIGQRGRGLTIDLGTGESRAFQVEPKQACFSLVAAPDGTAYLRGTAGSGFASNNGRTFVHNADFDVLKEIPNAGSRAAFSPTGRLVATGAWHGNIKLWTWPELQPAGTLGPVQGLASLHFSPDGRALVASGDGGEITLWDVETRTLRQRRQTAGRDVVGCARFSPDGSMIAAAGGSQAITLWSADTLEQNRLLRGYASTIWQLVWHPDSQSLVTTTPRSGLRVRDLANPEVANIPGFRASRPVRFSWDSKLLAAEFERRDGIGLWSTKDGRELVRRDGRYEICGFMPQDKALLLLDPARKALTYCSTPDLTTLRTVPLEQAADSPSPDMCPELSPDGSKLAQGTFKGPLLVWDASSGALLKSGPAHDGKINRVVFSSDGRWLATCGADQTARLWDTTNWREVKIYRGPRRTAGDVAISPDNRFVAVSWTAGGSVVYDRETTQPKAEFKSGYQLLFPDSRGLITTTHDRLHFWNLQTGRGAGSVPLPGTVGHYLAMSPDTTMVATITDDNTLRFFRAPHHSPPEGL